MWWQKPAPPRFAVLAEGGAEPISAERSQHRWEAGYILLSPWCDCIRLDWRSLVEMELDWSKHPTGAGNGSAYCFRLKEE
jgi:hypothetical protein